MAKQRGDDLRYIYLEPELTEHALQKTAAQMHGGIKFGIIDPPPPLLWIRTADKDQTNTLHPIKFYSVSTIKSAWERERETCTNPSAFGSVNQYR